MQRVLQRRLNPLLSTLPLCLFGAAVLIDFGASVSGFRLFVAIAYWVVAMSLLVGLITSTALLVDFTTSPVGSVAHRVRGFASASITGIVVAFTLGWYLRGDSHAAASGAVLVLEAVAFLGGLAGVALARTPQPSKGLFEISAEPGWPFGTAS